jgi:hypothetical protein
MELNPEEWRGSLDRPDALDELEKAKLKKLICHEDAEPIRSTDMLNSIDLMVILGINPFHKHESKEFSLVDFDENDEVSREEIYRILGV